MSKKVTAEEFFKNDNKEAAFTFVKYLNNDSDKISYKSSEASYKLKCKTCGNEKDIKRGNYSAGYKQCLICKKKNDNKKEKEKDEVKEEVENEIVFPNLPLPALPPALPLPDIPELLLPKQAGQNDSGYKIIDRKRVISIRGTVTEQVGNYFITTDLSKKELENHLFVSPDKAVIVDDFVFITNQESIFDKFKSISNLQVTEIESLDEEDKLYEEKLYNISEIRNKDVGPRDFYESVLYYFNLDLGEDFKKEDIDLNSTCFIFNSNTKFLFTLKGSDITFKANFCKAYLLSLILDSDKDADINVLAKKDLVKLSDIAIKKGNEISPKIIDSINTKKVSNAQINNFEKLYIFKNIIKLNKTLKDSYEKTLFENKSKILNKSEKELFLIKTGINEKSFIS